MSDRRIRYSLDDEKRFVVEDYNWAIPFSNFLPGIAGLWGVPLWVYYVNRGQAVCSVGGPRQGPSTPGVPVVQSGMPSRAGRRLFTEKAQRLPYYDSIRGRIDIDVPANAFAFKLLGRTLVIYRNEARKNTWGTEGARPVRYAFTFRDGTQRVVDGVGVDSELAIAVRDGHVEELEVTLSVRPESV